jgi:hypothetical protein
VFRVAGGHETNHAGHETIFCFHADIRKQHLVINLPTTRRTAPLTGDSQMRTFSFILAFAAFLVGPSLADSSEVSLPGIGTFSYNGSPVISDAPQLAVVAAR